MQLDRYLDWIANALDSRRDAELEHFWVEYTEPRRQDTFIFRYDNAPHHPNVATFPHHKHVVTPRQQEESIEPATPPHFNEVLREIERVLYPDSA